MNRLRWWERILGVSVRMKIMGIALGMLVLLSLGVVWHVRSVFQQTLRNELETRGYSLARTLAVRSADFVLTRDLFELHKLVIETSEQYEDLRYVFILNNQGEVLAHTFGALFPIDLLHFNTGFASGATHVEIVSSEEGPIWDVAAPILTEFNLFFSRGEFVVPLTLQSERRFVSMMRSDDWPKCSMR